MYEVWNGDALLACFVLAIRGVNNSGPAPIQFPSSLHLPFPSRNLLSYSHWTTLLKPIPWLVLIQYTIMSSGLPTLNKLRKPELVEIAERTKLTEYVYPIARAIISYHIKSQIASQTTSRMQIEANHLISAQFL